MCDNVDRIFELTYDDTHSIIWQVPKPTRMIKLDYVDVAMEIPVP